MHCCPTCGHALDKVPMVALGDAKLSPQLRMMLQELVDAYPRYVNRDSLFETLYGLDPNGGPENIANAVAVRIFHIRKVIEPLGWTIPRSKTGTGNYGRYRLQPIQEA